MNTLNNISEVSNNILRNESTEHTIQPSGRQQSIRSLLKSLSSSKSSNDPFESFPHSSRKFLEDLALRSRNRFQSKKRVFIDMPNGFAFLLMVGQLMMWAILCFFPFDWENFINCSKSAFILIKNGPIFLFISISFAFISSIFLYFWCRFTIHFVSISVLIFSLYNATFNLPKMKITSGNFASFLTFLFLLIYYIKGFKHLKLTIKFIKSASRLCWRNHISLGFVFLLYTVVIYIYLIMWSFSIMFVQNRNDLGQYVKLGILAYSVFSLMLVGSFLRDLLQIWLSRIVYTSTFAYASRPVVVTSLTKKELRIPLEIEDCEGQIHGGIEEEPEIEYESGNASSPVAYEEIKRVVSRESMWWCMGTASRSAIHLVLRGFQIHIWILTVIQIFFPNLGPPAEPSCVLDVFHVPTAIYGTSFSKSRRFVADTMVNHGMDKISVDLYLRTFIYYMITYACGILSLLTIWMTFGSEYKFKISFLVDCIWSLITKSDPVNFACIFVSFGTVLYFTAIDSVHMILCWSICETPTSVSALEPELMHTLVTIYHARLDLKRFSGDRIRTSK